eukprot:6057654-Alexandrium_andersonii.AAC.1
MFASARSRAENGNGELDRLELLHRRAQEHAAQRGQQRNTLPGVVDRLASATAPLPVGTSPDRSVRGGK